MMKMKQNKGKYHENRSEKQRMMSVDFEIGDHYRMINLVDYKKRHCDIPKVFYAKNPFSTTIIRFLRFEEIDNTQLASQFLQFMILRRSNGFHHFPTFIIAINLSI